MKDSGGEGRTGMGWVEGGAGWGEWEDTILKIKKKKKLCSLKVCRMQEW